MVTFSQRIQPSRWSVPGHNHNSFLSAGWHQAVNFKFEFPAHDAEAGGQKAKHSEGAALL